MCFLKILPRTYMYNSTQYVSNWDHNMYYKWKRSEQQNCSSLYKLNENHAIPVPDNPTLPNVLIYAFSSKKKIDLHRASVSINLHIIEASLERHTFRTDCKNSSKVRRKNPRTLFSKVYSAVFSVKKAPVKSVSMAINVCIGIIKLYNDYNEVFFRGLLSSTNSHT